MKFILLKSTVGNPRFLNAKSIASLVLTRGEAPFTIVRMNNNDSWEVTETPERILELINFPENFSSVVHADDVVKAAIEYQQNWNDEATHDYNLACLRSAVSLYIKANKVAP